MKDENVDKPAEFDDELQQLYRAQEQEVPSAELDEAILKLARASVKKAKMIMWSSWRRVFGVVIVGHCHRPLLSCLSRPYS